MLEERFVIEGDDIPEDEQQALCTALHSWVAAVFLESQRRVPFRTGRLQASGYVWGEVDWRGIIYDTEYAEIVEEGRGEPGEPYYFEGRHFLRDSIDELMSSFETHLKLALHGSFEVVEAS